MWGGDGGSTNLDVVTKILGLMGKPAGLIDHVSDRPGHDVRYAIETSQSLLKLGWKKAVKFDDGLRETINHYLSYRKEYENHEGWTGEWD